MALSLKQIKFMLQNPAFTRKAVMTARRIVRRIRPVAGAGALAALGSGLGVGATQYDRARDRGASGKEALRRGLITGIGAGAIVGGAATAGLAKFSSRMNLDMARVRRGWARDSFERKMYRAMQGKGPMPVRDHLQGSAFI